MGWCGERQNFFNGFILRLLAFKKKNSFAFSQVHDISSFGSFRVSGRPNPLKLVAEKFQKRSLRSLF